MASPILTANFPDAIDVAVSSYFNEQVDIRRKEANPLFGLFSKEENINKKVDYESGTSGIPRAVATDEGDDYAVGDRTEGYKVTYTQAKYTQSIEISEEMRQFDQKGKIKNSCGEVADACMDKSVMVMADIFNYATTTTKATGGDSVALACYNHPSPVTGQSTQRNICTAAQGHLALTPDNLVTVKKAGKKFKLFNGELAKWKPSILLVSGGIEDLAYRITMADKWPAVTGSLEPNPIRNWKIKVTAVDEINSDNGGTDTFWALIDERLMKKFLKIKRAWAPRLNPKKVRDNNTWYYGASTMLAVGFSHWIWMIMSKGDGSTISA